MTNAAKLGYLLGIALKKIGIFGKFGRLCLWFTKMLQTLDTIHQQPWQWEILTVLCSSARFNYHGVDPSVFGWMATDCLNPQKYCT